MERARRRQLGVALRRWVAEGAARADPLLAALGALEPAARVAVFAALGARDMALLFEACADRPPLSVADLLPAHAQPGRSYAWLGVNSLPLARRFEKRLFLPERGARTLPGYNQQPLMALTGPGCFVAHAAEAGAPGAVVFDYTRAPEGQPPGWPRVRPAGQGWISRLVYGDMEDFMRAVCDDVLIGRAYKRGRATNNYFVLVRGGRCA